MPLRLLPVLGPGNSSSAFSKQDVRLRKQTPAFNENHKLCQSKGAGASVAEDELWLGLGSGETAGWTRVTEAVGGNTGQERKAKPDREERRRRRGKGKERSGEGEGRGRRGRNKGGKRRKRERRKGGETKGRKRGGRGDGESVLFPLGLVLASSDLAFQRALAISLQHLILPGSAMEP